MATATKSTAMERTSRGRSMGRIDKRLRAGLRRMNHLQTPPGYRDLSHTHGRLLSSAPTISHQSGWVRLLVGRLAFQDGESQD